METIFVLTVMAFDGDKPVRGRSRTWGWFPTLAQAEQTVKTNDADIYENGYYNVVVVEEMAWGSLAMAKAEHWYSAVARLDDERCVAGYTVTKIDKPAALQNTVSFGMG
jgi:hypothetical protein